MNGESGSGRGARPRARSRRRPRLRSRAGELADPPSREGSGDEQRRRGDPSHDHRPDRGAGEDARRDTRERRGAGRGSSAQRDRSRLSSRARSSSRRRGRSRPRRGSGVPPTAAVPTTAVLQQHQAAGSRATRSPSPRSAANRTHARTSPIAGPARFQPVTRRLRSALRRALRRAPCRAARLEQERPPSRSLAGRAGPSLPADHHGDPVADSEELVEVARDEEDRPRVRAADGARRAARGSPPSPRRRSRASARRGAGGRSPRRGGARARTFCWFPPDSARTRSPGREQRIRRRSIHGAAARLDRAIGAESRRRDAVERGERHVVSAT
jgi:hypothetical protein